MEYLDKPLDLVILVPVFNEVDNIQPLVKEVAQALTSLNQEHELVFIDDGSTDHTWQVICAVQLQYPWVRGLRHVRQLGQSAALWTGFHCTQSQLIATLDGDLQNDPADLPRLLAGLHDADFICGVRRTRQDSWCRRFSSRVARWARRALLGVDFCDTGCGLKAFKRSLLVGLFGFKGFHRFLPIFAYWQGAITKEIPVSHRPRITGKSKYGVWNRLGCGILDLLAMAWFNQRRINGHQPGISMQERMARLNAGIITLLCLLALLTGCESAGPNTERGAVMGAGMGGLGGAIIGHQSGRTLEGLGIGAAVGAVGGAMIGNSIDRSYTPPPRTVIVEAPPAPTVEARPPAPDPAYIWIPGYWVWQGNGWVWAQGHWAPPPRPEAIWVPGYWYRDRGGWVWVEGYWR